MNIIFHFISIQSLANIVNFLSNTYNRDPMYPVKVIEAELCIYTLVN